jgi:hypothetical protein
MKGEYRQYLLEPFAGAFSTDGKWLFLGGADKQITIVDVTSLTEVRKLPRQKDPFNGIESVDNNHIAVRYFDEDGLKPPHVLRWDLQAGTAETIAEKDVTGSVVKGKLWLANANGKELEIWSVN